MRSLLRQFLDDRRGATALEYAMIAIFVSIVVIAGAASIGTRLNTLYFGELTQQVGW